MFSVNCRISRLIRCIFPLKESPESTCLTPEILKISNPQIYRAGLKMLLKSSSAT
jgi:hypothetical protein